jgi:xanthine dehydrogenase YagS FAD-binding subunit
MNAVVQTSKRSIAAEDFFEVGVTKTTVLGQDEIVTEIRVQAPPADTKSSFVKLASRKTIDFPIVNCAAMITTAGGKVSVARICLNAVYVTPYRAAKAEESIRGQRIDETTARAAGDAAVFQAKPLRHNRYMVQVARTMVERVILACR